MKHGLAASGTDRLGCRVVGPKNAGMDGLKRFAAQATSTRSAGNHGDGLCLNRIAVDAMKWVLLTLCEAHDSEILRNAVAAALQNNHLYQWPLAQHGPRF